MQSATALSPLVLLYLLALLYMRRMGMQRTRQGSR
jgi:uncharacterized protein (TIGR03382 family)